MFQKKIRIILLWCAGALALLSLLALLHYTFFYKPDMLLGKANDLDRAFSNMVKLPENAYIGNVETQYFEKANFKGAYTMYGGTYAPMRLLGEEMLAETNPGGLGKENCFLLSDGSLATVPNWILRTVNMGGESHSHIELQEEWEKEMPYQAEIKYQNGPFFLCIFTSCSNPKDTGGCKALYEDMVQFLNHVVWEYDGEQNWEGQTTGWYPAP